MNINYSIIIPHKNSPLLLQRCLDSIPKRKDIQVIIIDDNSDATKVDFEHFPGINIDGINIIFSKEGKGAGAARNKGLQIAVGKWLLFADADDFFNPCFIDTIDSYLHTEADVVYFSVNSVYSDTLMPGFRGKEINHMVIEAIQMKKMDKLRYQYLVPFSKMIRRDMVEKNHLSFDETLAHNDAMFSVKCGYYADKIEANIAQIYCATCDKNSVSHRYTEEIARDRLIVFRNINYFLEVINERQYKINLIPYLLCIHNWELRSFLKRMHLLSFKYYIFDVWSDFITTILFVLKLYFNKSSHKQYVSRKNLIKGKS